MAHGVVVTLDAKAVH